MQGQRGVAILMKGVLWFTGGDGLVLDIPRISYINNIHITFLKVAGP